jgi:hypothetical protein
MWCRLYYIDLLDFLECSCSKALHHQTYAWKPGDVKCVYVNELSITVRPTSYLLDNHRLTATALSMRVKLYAGFESLEQILDYAVV